MSGTSTDDLAPGRRAMTIAGFRSSLAVSSFAVPFRTIAGPVSGTAFRFRGGRL
jgi:ABC-type dipeptide/oligopeptide/nickel transport system permease subunit